METKEKISYIRAQAIRANPDISKGMSCESCKREAIIKGTCVMRGRACRLADVLFVMLKKFGMSYEDRSFNQVIFQLWNLKEDNLELQSLETIEFIYNLLK